MVFMNRAMGRMTFGVIWGCVCSTNFLWEVPNYIVSMNKPNITNPIPMILSNQGASIPFLPKPPNAPI